MSENFKFPKFPEWQFLNEIDATGNFWDNQELSNLNSTLIKTTIKLREISKELTKYERKKAETEIAYKRKFREELLTSTLENATNRKLAAEVACEDLEWKNAYLDEVIKELTREAFSLRTELDTLKTVGHNLRQEMRL